MTERAAYAFCAALLLLVAVRLAPPLWRQLNHARAPERFELLRDGGVMRFELDGDAGD